VKRRKITLRQRLAPVVASAYFWYALLSITGAVLLSSGVGIEYGIGHGLIAFGVLSVAASELVRRGMTRA
jgi:hypothetical protein